MTPNDRHLPSVEALRGLAEDAQSAARDASETAACLRERANDASTRARENLQRADGYMAAAALLEGLG